ncbi:hypothetical protein KCH_66660 [Kitasatospora cheerisanensis KCTC 2395]|uniref:Precorrin-6Y C5,15-methyltransferase n=1 Tax=Kitasatospora cheerisanensis KCTC 2395 TaxID=1348663 RepID=A0A066YNM6_9ACTN|nr:hypothetical protein KCH_66660 [Kitasatospora cheerisanensis KCTC 2395]
MDLRSSWGVRRPAAGRLRAARPPSCEEFARVCDHRGGGRCGRLAGPVGSGPGVAARGGGRAGRGTAVGTAAGRGDGGSGALAVAVAGVGAGTVGPLRGAAAGGAGEWRSDVLRDRPNPDRVRGAGRVAAGAAAPVLGVAGVRPAGLGGGGDRGGDAGRARPGVAARGALPGPPSAGAERERFDPGAGGEAVDGARVRPEPGPGAGATRRPGRGVARGRGGQLVAAAGRSAERAGHRLRGRPGRAVPAAHARPARRTLRVRRAVDEASRPGGNARGARTGPGELLWDIGGGSGSIGIEWLRAHRSCRAVSVERDPVRAERIVRNAAALGVPGLRVVQGKAPAALAELDVPDAVFIGGGLTAPGLLEACWAALRPGGRLVANTVTLESEALLTQWYRRCGGELVKLSVAHAVPVGGFTGWRQAMPVTQWSVVKGGCAGASGAAEELGGAAK